MPYFVGRCSLPLPPFPPSSSVPKPVPQRRAPSPASSARAFTLTPRQAGGTHADTPSHQLAGTDGMKPHGTKAELWVPRERCPGPRARARSRSPALARRLPALTAAFARASPGRDSQRGAKRARAPNQHNAESDRAAKSCPRSWMAI